MQTLRYSKAVRLDQLGDELLAAGLRPAFCGADGSGVRIDIDDATAPAAIDAVIAAHDPTRYDQRDTQAATRRQQDIDLAKQYLALAPGTATLAQTQAYGQALGRLVRDLARIV